MNREELLKLCDYLECNDASMEAQREAAAFIRKTLKQPYPDNFIDALKYDVALREFDPDYRAMYLEVRDELAALQQSRAPLTSKEIRAIEVDVATNLSLDYPSPAEQFTRAIEARHGIK